MNEIHAGNPGFATAEDDLTSLFEAHGTATEAAIPTNRMSGLARGFVFVPMSTDAGMLMAVEALIGGRQITAALAQPKAIRAGKPRAFQD